MREYASGGKRLIRRRLSQILLIALRFVVLAGPRILLWEIRSVC